MTKHVFIIVASSSLLLLLTACQSYEPDDHWEWWYSLSGKARLTDSWGTTHTVWLHAWDLSHREGGSFDLSREKDLSLSLLAKNTLNEVETVGQLQLSCSKRLIPGSISIGSVSMSVDRALPRFESRSSTCSGCTMRVDQLQGKVAEEPSGIIFGDHVTGQQARLGLDLAVVGKQGTVRLHADRVDLSTGWRHAPQPSDDYTANTRYYEEARP